MLSRRPLTQVRHHHRLTKLINALLGWNCRKRAFVVLRNVPSKIELWSGPECTICRVGNKWRDQARETGHDRRLEDLDHIADLGIKTVRYPILWERAAEDCSSPLDLTWADRQLERWRELGVEVIGALVHHGSGPPGTDLLHPDFPSPRSPNRAGGTALIPGRRGRQKECQTNRRCQLTARVCKKACLTGFLESQGPLEEAR